MTERKYSFETGEKNSFSIVDYVIFAATLLISAAIGIYYAVKDRKKQNVKEFLLAGGKMPILPVALSLLATFMSAITLLGTPAEMYNYTTMYLWIGIGYVITMACTAHIFIPVFYRLKITSCYEYLELRFNKLVRTISTVIYVIHMTIYMGIVLYGPSLAVNAVTGLSLWGAICAVGSVCILYTTLGGMKAVLWTDTFQIIMMGIGLLAALIQGSIEIGGFGRAWEIADKNQRVVYDDFNVLPTVRHTFWSLVIGGSFLWTSIYAANQAQIQRAVSCSSLRRAQIAIWLNAPGLVIILFLCSLIGIVMYAFYSTCDPLKFGLISASDQLFPLFVMDILGHIPGIPGLFIACIFSGTLSSISSGLNALAAVVLEDIIKPYCLKDLRESRATLISRIIAFVFGLVCLGLTWVASQMGSILQATHTLFSILGAPALGLFTLGMLFPWANAKGALAGLLTSVVLLLWIGFGSFIAGIPPIKSPVSISGCNWTLLDDGVMGFNNITFNPTGNTTNITIPSDIDYSSPLTHIYQISYLWYSVLAVVIVLLVGLPVSFITGAQNPSELDPKLICPIFDIVLPCLPYKIRHFLYFGVKHPERKMKEASELAKKDENQESNNDILLSDLSKEIKMSPSFSNNDHQKNS
ncbi:hypothetical protein LOTGIDRAFT_185388 [Lottia gigantea]|uniref:Sodium-coupled monocarboxylate transporter 1 n=1 Tax=Lottia gigantea TaxID=225164 RepID=V4B9F0_LOTGI|nr:hypothetical protein LOTGIDRAFT_185388 [Lottia gigantea]ESP04001.1 hypothetical protein LOTGIDRAFT_185388 [Lottia gigantea]